MGVAQAPGRFGGDPEYGGASRLGRGERLYAGLLRAFPAPFRARFQEEMVQLFSDQLRDARTAGGSGRLAVTWFRSLADLASSAVGEHLRRDRTMAQSLATFEPSRPMRGLGVLAIVGGTLLLWAFVSWDPFADPNLNSVRIGLFWLGGVAVALAFSGRQAAVRPRAAFVATAVVVVTGIWNILWVVLAVDRDSPFSGAFGLLGFWAGFLGWLGASLYGAVSLVGTVWRGMPRWSAGATRLAALSLLVGGIVGTFGMDRLGLSRLEGVGELFGTLGALGVGAVGLGWLLLGAVLLLTGRGSRAGGPAHR